jgi:uncharacterized protein (DUF2062 family)
VVSRQLLERSTGGSPISNQNFKSTATMPEPQVGKKTSGIKRLIRKILMLDDTPHSIALGTAIGMWIGMTPTVGVQMILVIIFWFLTRPLFRFNKFAAILTVYLSNPFTIVPIYYFNYWVGTWFVEGTVKYEDFARILEYDGAAEWWDTVIALFVTIGWPLILGSLIVATAFSIPTYPMMLWLLKRHKQQPTSDPPIIPSEPETSVAEESR